MATTGRTAATESDASALAAVLSESDFVHFVSHADGDSLAAAAILANAITPETPFQVSTVRSRAAADRRIESATAATVTIGVEPADADADATLRTDSNALSAFDVATEFGSPDPGLAMAGAIAAGIVPSGDAVDVATESGIERRPGVGIPTADLGDGLAHSTLFHADVSGDEQRAGALLAELELPAAMDETAHRRVGSAVALAATEPPAPDSAVAAIERSLRPHVLPDGPFETVEGFADVLEVLARSAPGRAAALALGHDERTDVLETWREYAAAVHDAVRLGERTRRSGIVAIETDRGDPWTTARLVRDFRSAEPNVLAVGDAEIALATTDDDAVERLDALDAVESIGGRIHLASGTPDEDPDAILASLEADR